MEFCAVEEQIDQLLKCLETELTLSEQLLELGKEQQQSLIKREDDRLQEITAVQDAKIRQLSVARKRSESAASSVAASCGLDPKGYTLADIAETLGNESGTRIGQTTARLVNTAGELYKQNLLNKNLLMNAVQYVSFCLKLISGADEPVGYGGSNAVKPRPSALILDQAA